MKSKLVHAGVSLVVFTGLSLLFVGSTWRSDARPAAAEQEHEVEPFASGDAASSGDTHEHGDEADVTHLSLDTLAARQCEHDVSILDCDECRYETGVVKIEPSLADGLVRTQVVSARSHAVGSLQLTGEVQLDLTRVVEVACAGGGRVEQIRKTLGDKVRASDVLAVVQSSEYGDVQAAFLEARARLDLARQTHERETQLRRQKISSEADYLAACNELAAAQASVAATGKRLQLFGLDDVQMEAFAQRVSDAVFGQLVLTSPIDGTIIEQNAVRGRLVDTTDTLYRIADLSRVWVWCSVYESDLAAVHDRIPSGRPVGARIHAGAFPDTAFTGTVDMIGSELDRQTRTLQVRVTADNPEGRLKPGMFVKVLLDLGDTGDTLMVPETAVLSDAGRRFVFVKLTDALWIRRDVTVGRAADGLVEVYDGLADGDIVAVKGAFMFKSEVLKEKMGAGCAH